MSSLPQSIPSSFRSLAKPTPAQMTPAPVKTMQPSAAQTSRFAASLLTGRRSAHLNNSGIEPRSPIVIHDAAAKGRVARLPHEPEDARITGVTRSLHRRLLALNVGGSLATHPLNARNSRIA